MIEDTICGLIGLLIGLCVGLWLGVDFAVTVGILNDRDYRKRSSRLDTREPDQDTSVTAIDETPPWRLWHLWP